MSRNPLDDCVRKAWKRKRSRRVEWHAQCKRRRRWRRAVWDEERSCTCHMLRETSPAACLQRLHTTQGNILKGHQIQCPSSVTRHTSHVTRHTSHVTRHTSHVTRHTSHVTRHSTSSLGCTLWSHKPSPMKYSIHARSGRRRATDGQGGRLLRWLDGNGGRIIAGGGGGGGEGGEGNG
jgi:hypothetical protein